MIKHPTVESNEVKVIMGVGRYSRLIYLNYKVHVSAENIVSITFSIDLSILKNMDQVSIERSQDGKTYYTIFYYGSKSLKRINSYSDFSSNLFGGLWYRMRIKHSNGMEIVTQPIFKELQVVQQGVVA